MKKHFLVSLLATLLLGISCSKDDDKILPIPVKTISFIDAPSMAGIGQPVKLNIKTLPENADVPYTLEWTVDNALADFDEATQTLTRKANGAITVTVSIKERPEVKSSVTINPIPVESVTFKTKRYTPELGESVKIEVTTTPEGADAPQLVWELSNDKATFNSSTYMLTLNSYGEVSLSVSLKDKPENKDVCTIKNDPTIAISDASFKQFLLSKFDSNKDGEIQQSEALDVTIINADKQNFQALREIVYFTNLKELSCSGCGISTLDISKCSKLEVLDCSNNNLSAIDLSKNPLLKNLDCGKNDLTTLDVSNNPQLYFLTFTTSRIPTIDLSKNSKLAYLTCYNGSLTRLDVSKNTELLSINCSLNKLSELDVTSNTKLISLSLGNAQYSSYKHNDPDLGNRNSISSINIKNNVSLASLDCKNLENLSAVDLTSSTELTNLYCMACNLSEVDVSRCTKLTYIDCGINNLTSLDVSNNVNLTSLECARNNISSIDVSKNTKLTNLWVASNNISALDVTNNTKLTSLGCGANKISSLNVSNNTLLTHLLISSNNLSEIDISNNKLLTFALFGSNPASKIYVWKGFTPPSNFTKDAGQSYVEVP